MFVMVKRVLYFKKPNWYKFDEEKEEIHDCKGPNLQKPSQE